MKQLDILFIHPNASAEIYQELSKEHSAIETPIWAGMLAQHVRIKGYGVQILDCEAERLNYKQAATIIKDINPRIACFVIYGQQPSASTQNMEGAVALVQEVKELAPSIKTLFVGAHVSALPDEVLSYKAIDFVCQNEGVYTISNLLAVEDLNNHSYLEKVDGLGWKNFNFNQLNKTSPIVSHDRLGEDLPGVAWDLLPPPTKYRTSGWHAWSNGSVKTPFASLYTSLGCPFKCSFCMINIINRTDNSPGVASDKSAVFRYWHPDHIIKEFDKLAEMGVKNVKIADELFVLREQHFMEICDRLIQRNHGFNIWCYSRVDTCKPQYLEKLKKAGVNWLALGIESPNQTVRKDVIKGGYKEVKITDLLKMISDAGIHIGANYIFGLPEDTHETMQETLDFAMDAKTENCNVYSTMAYPGSPLHYTAKQNGWTLPDRYSGYSQHSYHCQNLPSKNLSAAEVLKFRDEAWMKYFTNESYLSMMESKFGKPAVDNIRATTQIKLKRRLLGD
jgi:anaerobic magnesium-protoporphyrin IX monomethyl ester cyclase